MGKLLAKVRPRREIAPVEKPRPPAIPAGVRFRDIYTEAHPRLARVSYEKRRDGWYWRSTGPDPYHLRELGPFKTYRELLDAMGPFEEQIIRDHEAKARAFGHAIVELRHKPGPYDGLPLLIGLIPAAIAKQLGLEDPHGD